jgi:hypothetical protein
MNDRFPRTIQYYEDTISQAILVYKTNSEDCYFCPYCLDKELKYNVPDPKADEHGKLYINRILKQGICFRCNTVIVNRHTEENSFDAVMDLLQRKSSIKQYPHELPTINIDNMILAYNIPEAMAYLKERNSAFTKHSVRKLDMRWIDCWRTIKRDKEYVKIKSQGILTPLRFQDQIKSFQIRYLTDKKKERFYTMNGTKILFQPKKIPPQSDITICEGIYDSLALLAMGYPYPVALLGKTPSKLQEYQLQELMPQHVNLCLDKTALNYSLLGNIKKTIKTIETFKSWDFYGDDPEKFYKKNPNFKYRQNLPDVIGKFCLSIK